jgi:23S rRNA (cytosine1962-C5)-methyltransferase
MRMAQEYNPRPVSTVMISTRGADRLRAGHPWIYRSDVVKSDAAPGDLVRVMSDRQRPLAWAFWSSLSQIALRVIQGTAVTRASDDDGRALISERLRAAIAYRSTLSIDATAWRVVNAEADCLPGLIVDRYGDCLVIQTLCQATDRRLSLIVELLVEQLQPRGILARNDPRVRRLEGLEENVSVVYGDVPDRLDVTEGRIHHDVDLRLGQKTGLFLDQRDNHAAAARYARGRALDAFTYQGGFALQMAAHATSVIALDSSAPAIAALQASAERNGLSNIEPREVNVFDELRELEVSGERFETIVLDPPAFAKNKASVPRALAGYKEINLRALKLLSPGGHLLTCSCSYNVDEVLFSQVVEAAAADARATVALVEKRQQATDHPVLIGVPETHYLKCLVVRKVA